MLRKYKPVTPGQRFKVRLIKPKKDSNLYKNLVREGRIKYRKASRGGRNQTGRITVRGRGNIEKRRVRVLDYKREKGQHSLGITSTLRYNPSISATMAIIESGGDSKRRWAILAPEGLQEGQVITGHKLAQRESTSSSKTILGEAKPIGQISVGQAIYNIGGKYIRAAGTQGIIQRRWQDKKGQWHCEVLMPSGIKKSFKADTIASIGQVSNANHQLEVYGKAGTRRRLGWRPIVRGEARNPIDHPHGGKSHGSGGKGNPARNVWGKLAKWIPTARRITSN